MMTRFPTPSTIVCMTQAAFIEPALPLCHGKLRKDLFLAELSKTAITSIGVPVRLCSQAVIMFKRVAQDYLQAIEQRQKIELRAEAVMANHPDFLKLRTIAGIGPVLALNILAEAGNLRRFGHEKQFLKFCGLDLSTQQSATMRGKSVLSKRGNTRLCATFWMAARVAVRMRENGFARKFVRYTSRAPNDCGIKRRAYTAAAAKMAHVAYHVVKREQIYRLFYEEMVIRRKNPLNTAVEAETS